MERNPKYSLRAFARASGVSHTVLSLVLNGKRSLSRKAARKLADFLALSAEGRQTLLSRDEASRPRVEYQRLTLDTFSVIADWYHYAILSYLELPGSRFEALHLAQKLGIEVNVAEAAMARLVRLGLVMVTAAGATVPTGLALKVENTVSTAATRRFHRQLLEKAGEALDRVAIEERDFSSMTLILDPAEVPYAKKKIQDFRRNLVAELEKRGRPQKVYKLSVQLFPVSESCEGSI